MEILKFNTLPEVYTFIRNEHYPEISTFIETSNKHLTYIYQSYDNHNAKN